MRSSTPLFDALAGHYDEHFSAPHRRAYDDLSWEVIQRLLPPRHGHILDAGCGSGRWARRLTDLGHSVVGIEPAPAMAAAAAERDYGGRFEIVTGSMEDVDLAEETFDVVIALGSLQYTVHPEAAVSRLVGWLKTGGTIALLVDSLIALVLELLASGKDDEALLRLVTRKGTWIQGKHQADHHLLDRISVERALRRAGVAGVQSRGLLVGASVLGRCKLLEELTSHWDQRIAVERQLAEYEILADLGKQLLVTGTKNT